MLTYNKMTYYIGGFGETCNSDASKKLREFGAQCIPVDWGRSLSENIRKLNAIEDGAILVSFSLGAVIALELCVDYPNKVQSMIICSLSPYSGCPPEDIPKEVCEILGQGKIDELSSLDFKKYYQIDIPVTFLYGENENQETKNKIRILHENWKCPNKKIIEIKSARHNIHEKVYLDSIISLIEKHSA